MKIFCLVSAFPWAYMFITFLINKVEKKVKEKISIETKFFMVMMTGMILMLIIGITIDKAWIWCK